MRILKIVLKKILIGSGFTVLTLIYLFFIFWIENFHYLGSEFPYLFIFLLPPLIIGRISRRTMKKTIMRWLIPFMSAFVTYVIIVVSYSGLMRLWGWFGDLGISILLFGAASLLMFYTGWFFKNSTKLIKKWGVSAISLIVIFTTILQFYIPNYSNYYYIGEGVLTYIPQNLNDKSYQEVFDILCTYLDKKYPYFKYKHIDWEKVKKEAQDELRKLKTDEHFHKVIIEMLSHLQDPHVQFSPPVMKNRYKKYASLGARFTSIDGKLIVLETYSKSTAEKIGLRPGMEITKFKSKPIVEALAEVSDKQMNLKRGSERDKRFGDLHRFYRLISGSEGDKISISYVDADGIERSVDEKLIKLDWKWSKPISYKRLKEGFGYIKISYMAVDLLAFVPAFDKALESLWDSDGLIIDIRGNPGGAIVLSDQILGRFTDYKVWYGGFINSERKYAPLYVVPRHPIYKKHIVILIDERCGSAADFFSYAASHINRIKLVGRPTRGVVSSPSKTMILPGNAKVQLVASGLSDKIGNYVVEWVGVQPDVLIPYSIEDIRSSIDRDLIKAIDILKKKSL